MVLETRSTEFSLRLLELPADLDHYRDAYNWRADSHRRVLPDRMSLEDFTAGDGIAIGLFNGELRAVYFLHETEPGNFQAHFTSQRNIPRETLLAAASQVAHDFFAAGAVEIHAWVTERNTALRHFLTQLGFSCVENAQFRCAKADIRSTMPSDRNQRSFVKYSLKVNRHGPFRQKADFNPDIDG